jgi:hypothetical protein
MRPVLVYKKIVPMRHDDDERRTTGSLLVVCHWHTLYHQFCLDSLLTHITLPIVDHKRRGKETRLLHREVFCVSLLGLGNSTLHTRRDPSPLLYNTSQTESREVVAYVA